MSLVSTDPLELKDARALWLAGRFEEALARFDSVLEEYPDHALALLDAARAFGAAYQIEKAERLLDRYLELEDQHAEALCQAAQSYRMIHRSEKAYDCYKAARVAGSLDAVSGLEFAMLLDRRGELSEALLVMEEALKSDPKFSEGRFFYAQILLRSGHRSSAIAMLEKIARDDRQHSYIRTRASYALAEAMDRAGKYHEAFRQAKRAKSLSFADLESLRTVSGFLGQQADQLRFAFDADTLELWKREMPEPNTPLCLLTGSPRSGTTLMEKVLDAHPGLVSSDEHDLFACMIAPAIMGAGDVATRDAGAALRALSPQDATQYRRNYLTGMEELIGEPIGQRVFLDKNPSMTELIPTWLRMAPHSKLLIMLRDPRDVVISCFLNYFPLNAYTVDFLTLEGTARRYAREMEYWLSIRDVLPSGQWMEVRYEDCVEDLTIKAKEVVTWLGLDWSEETMDYRSSLLRRLTKSPTYADVQQPVYQRAVGRWRAYASQIATVTSILAPFLEAFGYAPDS